MSDFIFPEWKSVFQDWKSAGKHGVSIVGDSETGLKVAHIRSLSALIQAIGYVKFKHKDKFDIYYRGQAELYAKTCVDQEGNYWFQPTALREARKSQSIATAKTIIADRVAAIRGLNSKFRCTNQYSDRVIEALLHQYGMTSTWIDVVDNIWIALWFACYKSDATVRFNIRHPSQLAPPFPKRVFYHMVRRNPRTEEATKPYAYIFLLAGKDMKSGKMEMIDLRKEIPSHFIRPHVQHGMMIRGRPWINMLKLVQGIIRIDLYDALEWLGEGRILLSESIFPPPNYDSGFKWLLENEMRIMHRSNACFPIYC